MRQGSIMKNLFMKKIKLFATLAPVLSGLLLSRGASAAGFSNLLALDASTISSVGVIYLIKLEADYILACQFLSPGNPADGAINDVYGAPTWVVPRENALAILGLLEAYKRLGTKTYLTRAQQAADYLVRIQDVSDGGWYDQYNYVTPALLSKSPTQAAEVMMAFYKLGYQSSRYGAMKGGAQFLLSCQNPVNKGGNDDGLIGGGKDDQGHFQTWRWASDNAFAYQALKAAESWARVAGENTFADQCRQGANGILSGINTVLYIPPGPPDGGVWQRVVDMHDVPTDPTFHDWINYAPQMLDVPAQGVGNPLVGTWIHQVFQTPDGACVWDDHTHNQRKSPGFSFQASLAWLDLGQSTYTTSALKWARTSTLWQITPDQNGIRGGWVDWIENGQKADWWMRFIDTSFYAITAHEGGYDFRTSTAPVQGAKPF